MNTNSTGTPSNAQWLVRAADSAVRQHRWRFISVCAIVGILILFVTGSKDEYEAQSSFYPELASAQDASPYRALAAQFGFSLPMGGATETLDFYVRLLKSPAILDSVAQKRFRVADEEPEETFLDLYNAKGRNPQERLRKGVKKLQQLIRIKAELAPGVVTVTTRARSPLLAETLNRALLEELNEFNLNRRQSRAQAERAFVEQRVADAKVTLNTAERALERFLEANRTYQSSPQLVFQSGRLQREVEFQLAVYSSLVQAYETARIEEVRNLPVVTLIENPEGSTERKRHLFMRLILAMLLGSGAAITAVLFAARTPQPPLVPAPPRNPALEHAGR